jgi:hypothetical protein
MLRRDSVALDCRSLSHFVVVLQRFAQPTPWIDRDSS